jgi:5-formyltetrahydrofolate cyclo-ligase
LPAGTPVQHGYLRGLSDWRYPRTVACGVVPPAGSDKAAWRVWASTYGPDGDRDAVLAGIRAFLRERAGTGRVLLYRAMGGEVDLDGLLSEFSCAVTRTWPKGRLTLHGVEVPMERHRWGYLQPVADAAELDRREIDVVLVPGLLFDRYGGRLGHGAGYYDRFLPSLRPEIPRIGVCLRSLDTPLPMESHDVRMTHIADESGVADVVRIGPGWQAGTFMRSE